MKESTRETSENMEAVSYHLQLRPELPQQQQQPCSARTHDRAQSALQQPSYSRLLSYSLRARRSVELVRRARGGEAAQACPAGRGGDVCKRGRRAEAAHGEGAARRSVLCE